MLAQNQTGRNGTISETTPEDRLRSLRESILESIGQPPPPRYHTATELGGPLGLSAQKVNLRLQARGLQYPGLDKSARKRWFLTEEGSRYGQEFDVEVAGGRLQVPLLKWKKAVLS